MDIMNSCYYLMMKRLIQRWSRIIAVIALITVSFVSIQAARADDWVPKDPPAIYPINAGPNAIRRNDPIPDICKTASQLDCLESVEAFIDGEWVKGVPSDQPTSWNGFMWTIAGLKNLNGTNFVNSFVQISYTGNAYLQALLTAPGGDSDGTGLQRDVKFRVTLRTSWVLPTHVSGKVTDGEIVVEKLATPGASRVSMSGVPILFLIVLDQSSLANPLAKGDDDVRMFNMTISDGRFLSLRKECTEKPTMLITDNAYGHAVPTFTSGNLDLKVNAPHFRKDGVTLHRGVYEAKIPLETAQCLWGSSIVPGSQFNVEVLDESGAAKPANTAFEVTSDAVLIKASGFTYSSPTIRVQYVSTPQTVVKTAAMRTSVKKTVTARKLAQVAKLKLTKSSKLSITVQKKSAKVCQVRSGVLQTLKKGTCQVTVTVQNGRTKRKQAVLVTVR
jgi:hypothetical protein